MTDQLKEWTEADGTVYRLNSEGNYDVIPPVKEKKSKGKVKKNASAKKAN